MPQKLWRINGNFVQLQGNFYSRGMLLNKQHTVQCSNNDEDDDDDEYDYDYDDDDCKYDSDAIYNELMNDDQYNNFLTLTATLPCFEPERVDMTVMMLVILMMVMLVLMLMVVMIVMMMMVMIVMMVMMVRRRGRK